MKTPTFRKASLNPKLARTRWPYTSDTPWLKHVHSLPLPSPQDSNRSNSQKRKNTISCSRIQDYRSAHIVHHCRSTARGNVRAMQHRPAHGDLTDTSSWMQRCSCGGDLRIMSKVDTENIATYNIKSPLKACSFSMMCLPPTKPALNTYKTRTILHVLSLLWFSVVFRSTHIPILCLGMK